MREVRSSQRRPRSGRIGFIALLVVTLSSCAGPAQSPVTTPSTNDQGIVAEVATYQVVADRSGRLLVALLTADNRWLSFGSVGMSFSYLGDGAGTPSPNVVAGDATAHFLPIPGSPEGDGRSPTLTFPADGRGVYAVEPITFPTAGYWQVVARGELGDGSQFHAEAAFTVLDAPSVITVGTLAPHTDNPVMDEPGVPPSAIDSRAAGGKPIPDPELHTTSIADAIEAGHPALVVFSTPVYCVSRFCGPVTDLVAELAAEYGDRADFIHVEIYRDFQAGQVNQAALDWLQTADGDLREPWTFLIGADGRIAGSWDTVVTRSEIEPLLRSLPLK
ncbi:MAG TPA: hypothetical protein VIL81_06160 [Candidatus Limnocylindrales bacterium]|jgi:hypothetical protein